MLARCAICTHPIAEDDFTRGLVEDVGLDSPQLAHRQCGDEDSPTPRAVAVTVNPNILRR